jgi:hypothetical protein
MKKYTVTKINSIVADEEGNIEIDKATVDLNNVDNTSDLDKPISTTQGLLNTTILNDAKAYSDSLVLGLVDDRGGYDASTNLFPAINGSGIGGAILKGDQYEISVAGTLVGKLVDIGDLVRALLDAPGQTSTNWYISSYNTQQATTSARGTTKLATDVEAITGINTDKTIVPSSLAAKLNDYNTNTLVTTYETKLNVNKLKSTRVISGTGVSINGDTTKFDIQVVGEIVDPNTYAITAINVNLTAQVVTNLVLQTESYITINSSGTVIQSLTPPDPITFDSILGAWVLIHSNLTNLNAVNNFPMYSDGVAIQLRQVLDFIGFAKYPNTNLISAGTTGTRFSHTGGFVIKNGGGNTSKRPVFSLNGATDATIRMRNRDDIESIDTQTIDVLNIDIGGVTTALTNNNRFGAHKVWKFGSSLVRIQRGQKSYANYDDAVVGIDIDTYIDSPNGFRNGIHIGWIVFRRNTSWSTGTDGVDFKFIQVTNGKSSSSVIPTEQTIYNASTQPQVLVDDIIGARQTKNGRSSDTSTITEWLNIAGTVTASIKGDGTGTFKNTPTNLIVVKTLSDLPTPIANNITLVSNTAYQINGVVNIGTNTITFNTSNLIFGIDKSNDQLIYTGTSGMLINSNKDCSIAFITLAAVTTGGSVYSFTGSTNKIEIRDVIYVSCKSLGTINGVDVLISSKTLAINCSAGLTIQGTCNFINLADGLWEGNISTMTCINIPTGTFKQLKISRNEFDIATTQTGVAIGTPTVTNAVLSDCDFIGSGTYLSGLSQITLNWQLRANRGTGIVNNSPHDNVQLSNSSNSNIVTNTTTETLFTGTGVQLTVAPNTLRVGSRIKATAWLMQSATLTPTLTIRSKGGSAGTTTFSSTQARTVTSSTNTGTYINFEITIRSVGVGGTCNSHIATLFQEGSFADGSIVPSNGTKTIDTTAINVFGLSVQWGAASVSNTIVLEDINWSIFY